MGNDHIHMLCEVTEDNRFHHPISVTWPNSHSAKVRMEIGTCYKTSRMPPLCPCSCVRPLVQSVGQSLCTLPPAEPSECGVLPHRQTEGSVTNMQGVNASISAYTFDYQDSYLFITVYIQFSLHWNGSGNSNTAYMF